MVEGIVQCHHSTEFMNLKRVAAVNKVMVWLWRVTLPFEELWKKTTENILQDGETVRFILRKINVVTVWKNYWMGQCIKTWRALQDAGCDKSLTSFRDQEIDKKYWSGDWCGKMSISNLNIRGHGDQMHVYLRVGR